MDLKPLLTQRPERKMSNKTEVFSICAGAGASLFATELIEKIVITCIAMLLGATVSFFWKRYLENKFKDS